MSTSQKIKPDKMLMKVAKQLGISLGTDVKKKKGESLLEFRQRRWGFPPITFQPIDNQVVVWRLPPLQLSPGGLIVPESEQSPNVKGVLLAAGPRAWDTLHSNGIEAGHVVVFSRFAGWETHDHTAEHQRHNQVLILKDKDIMGSDDLKAAMDAGKMKYTQGQDGKFRLAKVTKPERKMLGGPSERKRKLLALAARAGTPQEAETAKRIAARTK
jgi:co-chaperonin GroES (HSP10)